ncbi:MAG: hypothetical protein V4709_02985 [Pseudomonadota bacterium]
MNAKCNVLKAAAIYFALVFGTGFALGTLRVLLMVPMVGARTAELIESPLMLLVTIFAARWLDRHRWRDFEGSQRLAVGGIAVTMILLADLAVGVLLRGLSPMQVFISRDAVSGLVYYGLLAIFALMPWAIGWQRQATVRSKKRPG